MYIDSHTHLYLDAFREDRRSMIQRALDAGVSRMLLPNIDSSTTEALFALSESFPAHCFPMMGLHPTSVKENYVEELGRIEGLLQTEGIIAIGETGIDLYWDQSFLAQQEEVFRTQIVWAMELDLPLVIHARDSFPEIFKALEKWGGPRLRGVFHSFTGTREDLRRALSYRIHDWDQRHSHFQELRPDRSGSSDPPAEASSGDRCPFPGSGAAPGQEK
jgi:TatD DNase family protein